jgi:hypothetical protein
LQPECSVGDGDHLKLLTRAWHLAEAQATDTPMPPRRQ